MAATATTDSVKAVQQQVLDAYTQGQKVVVDAVGTWAKSVEGIVAKNDATVAPIQLPAPKELVETTFSFVEQLVASQKQFTLALIQAANPAFEKATQATNGKSA